MSEQTLTNCQQSQLSRRDFLRMSAVVAIGGALTACVLPGTAPGAGGASARRLLRLVNFRCGCLA